MGKNRISFSTKNLVGYVTNTEIDRPGFSYLGFFDNKHVYEKTEK